MALHTFNSVMIPPMVQMLILETEKVCCLFYPLLRNAIEFFFMKMMKILEKY